MRIFYFLTSLIFSIVVQARELCPSIQFDEPKVFEFTEMETRLLCGDDSKFGPEAAAWSNIPPSQAKLQMKTLLQARGYNQPKFTIKDGVLHVTTGEVTKVTKIILINAPAELDIDRKRGILGESLTPAILNDLEQWLDKELRFNGYACPTLSTQADGQSGIITVTLRPGLPQTIQSVDVNDELGLLPGVLRRYDAFQLGGRFSSRKIELTSSRIVNLDILANTNFKTECLNDGVHIHQKVYGGPARTFRLGAGLDTEEIVKSVISWRHTRLDNHGSIAELKAYGSFRKQSLSGDVYRFFTEPARAYVQPTISLSRDKESSFETTQFLFGAYLGSTGDFSDSSWLAQIGPFMEYDNTVVGPGPGASRNLLLKGQAYIESHSYEYYIGNPQTGYRTSIDLIISDKSELSQVSAQRISFLTEHLWNFKHFDPPLMVLGWRFGYTTTNTDLALVDSTLPTIFRNYLGGSTDVRGFGRQELPVAGTGALTTSFTSFELRFNSVLPASLQPFLFVDAGALGARPFSLSLPVYGSPGVGMRWASAIGVFRGTLAHGYAWSGDDPSNFSNGGMGHWQGFLSYGEEF